MAKRYSSEPEPAAREAANPEYDSHQEIAAMVQDMEAEDTQTWMLRHSMAGHDSPMKKIFLAEARSKDKMPDVYQEELRSGVWGNKIKARQRYDQLEPVAAVIGTLLGGSENQPPISEVKQYYLEEPAGKLAKKRLREEYPIDN